VCAVRRPTRPPPWGNGTTVRPVARGVWAESGHDAIVDAVRDAVAAGRLPAGTKLAEAELAGIFSVSRTRVRQALQRLGFVGLVTLEPNRGAFVASPSPEEANAVHAARRLIEAEIVRDATRHCTANDIRRLRAHCAEQRGAEADGDDIRFLRLLGEFHLLIAEIGGNPVLADFMRQLIPRTALLQALYQPPGHCACGVADHVRLVDRMAKGDEAGAVKTLRDHLIANLARLSLDPAPPRSVDLAAALRPGEEAGLAAPGRKRPTFADGR
jgi:DNA-binding GntR family transcriptional regulator